MTKELVEEAIGRPPEEQEVIAEAKRLLERITDSQKALITYESMKEDKQKDIKTYKHKLELLRQGKYKLKKSEWGTTGFDVEYKEA